MSKYIIYTGREWKQKFRVVSDDGITAEVLDPTDTATITILTAGANPTCVIAATDMVLIDADNGLFEAQLTTEQTADLEQKIGFQEDGYGTIGNHDGYLEFTLVSGNRQASILVDVKKVASCPVT